MRILNSVVAVMVMVGAIAGVQGVKVKEQTVLRGSKASAMELASQANLPPGNYLQSCQGCFIDASSVLTCSCFNSVGELQPASSISNAWSCETCLINSNGALFCQLPASSLVAGYQSLCSECGASFSNLICRNCNGASPDPPFILDNGCSCTDVSFNAKLNRLVCNTVTPAPTEHPVPPPTFPPTNQPTPQPVNPTFNPTFPTPNPTNPTPNPTFPTSNPTFPTSNPTNPTSNPTFPTKSPTPNAAPPACESYWLNINGNGIEKAPWKACTGGDFSTSNGCQYQNYCCWQATSSTTGVCVVPNGVPVDCPNLGQNDCQSNSQWCTWDSTYGTSGLCRRNCPGDPQAMCVY